MLQRNLENKTKSIALLIFRKICHFQEKSSNFHKSQNSSKCSSLTSPYYPLSVLKPIRTFEMPPIWTLVMLNLPSTKNGAFSYEGIPDFSHLNTLHAYFEPSVVFKGIKEVRSFRFALFATTQKRPNFKSLPNHQFCIFISLITCQSCT